MPVYRRKKMFVPQTVEAFIWCMCVCVCVCVYARAFVRV